MEILVEDISYIKSSAILNDFYNDVLHPLSFSNEGPYVLYTNIYNP